MPKVQKIYDTRCYLANKKRFYKQTRKKVFRQESKKRGEFTHSNCIHKRMYGILEIKLQSGSDVLGAVKMSRVIYQSLFYQQCCLKMQRCQLKQCYESKN